MNKFFYIILIAISLFIACKPTKTAMNTGFFSKDKYDITKDFLDAKRSLQRGNRSSAIEGFERCIKNNPEHDASYFELARINEFQNPDKAIEYISKAIEFSEGNIWYKEFLIRVLKQQKKYAAAIDVNKNLIKRQPNNKDYYYQRANLFIYNKNYKQANNTYNDILKLFGYEEGVLLQQKQIYLKSGNYNKAIGIVEDLINHHPKQKKYYGMLAEIYSKQNKKTEAMQYYQKILEIDPDDGFVHLALADYYRSEGNKSKLFGELKLAMSSKSLNIDKKMNVLLNLMDKLGKDKSKIDNFEKLLLLATNVNTKEPKILALNADYNSQQGKNKEAIFYFREILKTDSSKVVIWEQLLLVEKEIGDNSALLNESYRAIRLFPQYASLYYFNAEANIKKGNWKEVKEKAKMGYNFIYKKVDKASFLALRAKAEMHLGEIDDGVANFRSALVMDSQNAKIMKDYAYYLALNKRDLSTAIRYAKSALEMETNNPDYIYVYAYCLFKNGQKDEALKWINTALKDFPNNKKIQLLDMEINKNE